MKPIVQQRPESRLDDNWGGFVSEVIANANETLKDVKYLYRTDVSDIYDIYLNNLPIDKEHYTCNNCQQFLLRYGGLVCIKNNKIVPVFWNGKTKYGYFAQSVDRIYNAVKSSTIKGVFTFNENDINDTSLFGVAKNTAHLTGFEWSHLHYPVPATLTKKLEHRSKYIERYDMLQRVGDEIKTETIDLAISLINSGMVYRGTEYLHTLTQLKDLLIELKNIKTDKSIVLWQMIFENEAFYHVRSSAIYTFLEDLVALKDYAGNVDADAAIEKFNDKNDPNNKSRVKSDVSVAQIKITQKYFDDNGLTNALKRRYVKRSELPKQNFLWLDKSVNTFTKPNVDDDSGFGNIKPKQNKPIDTVVKPTNAVKMTWTKFVRTVLPEVKQFEVKVNNPSRLIGLTTESVENSGQLFQWGNPFAWYYNGGGADGEIKRRVIESGGQYDNNDIRCSLLWNTYTDLDLHCITPHGERIYYGHKKSSRSSGWLDVDKNVQPDTLEPVENIRFSKDTAPNGRYVFIVNNFTNRTELNEFKVELEINGVIYEFVGNTHRNSENITAFEFEYYKGEVNFIGNVNVVSRKSNWGVNGKDFVSVNSVITSPNTWSGDALKQSHVFFLIDGCKDDVGSGKGFMPEFLKSELKPHRKVLEHHTLNNAVQGLEDADAFGVGYNQDSDWNLEVLVKTNSLTQHIIIDRFE